MIHTNNTNIPIMNLRSRKAITLFRMLFQLFVLIFSYHQAQGQDQIIPNQNLAQPSLEADIKGYRQKADSLVALKKIEEAKKVYELAYQKAKDSENVDLFIQFGKAYANFLYWVAHRTEEALTICEVVQERCTVKKHRKDLIESHLLQAHILTYSKNEYSKALQVYSNTISLFDETISSSLKIKSYRKRGSLLAKINLVEAARKDFHKAISYIRPQEDYHRKIAIYYGISTTIPKKDIDSFLYYYNSIKDYCDHQDQKFWACPLNYKNMANFYTSNNNPEKAKKILEENIDTNEDYAKTFYSSYSCLHILGTVYTDLKQYDLAIETLLLAKEYASKERNFARVSHILKDLSEVYQIMGDLKSSIEATRMIKPLMDSLSSQKIKKQVAKLEIQNKLKKKEEEVVVLKKDSEIISSKTSKSLLLTYILSILLIIGVFLFINRIVVNKTEFYKLNEKVNHNRLLSLQSAMNPHFLFNTFGTLQHFILKKEIKKANSYMTTLSDLIRNVFASSNSIYIYFNSEIAILKSYLELELDRFDHSFEIIYDIPEELTKHNPMIPSMILQPYVENAIIHGFSEKEGNKKLTLRFIQISSKSIQCEITDNGVGRQKVEEIQKNSKTKGKRNLSIATKNTQERMRIINKKDEQDGSIVIQDLYNIEGKASGTKVIISLPIAENNII